MPSSIEKDHQQYCSDCKIHCSSKFAEEASNVLFLYIKFLRKKQQERFCLPLVPRSRVASRPSVLIQENHIHHRLILLKNTAQVNTKQIRKNTDRLRLKVILNDSGHRDVLGPLSLNCSAHSASARALLSFSWSPLMKKSSECQKRRN